MHRYESHTKSQQANGGRAAGADLGIRRSSHSLPLPGPAGPREQRKAAGYSYGIGSEKMPYKNGVPSSRMQDAHTRAHPYTHNGTVSPTGESVDPRTGG